MILAISIGNEKIDIGIMNKNETIFVSSISTEIPKTSDEYAYSLTQLISISKCNEKDIFASIICSVVPSLTDHVIEAVKKTLNIPVYTVKAGMKTGFSIKIDNPSELGTDIVSNVAGAIQIANTPFILLDLGVITTISAIMKKANGWEFVGCSIFPGIDSMKKNVQSKGAMLPEVVKPKEVKLIGTNTISSIASGIYMGNAIMIDGMINAYKNELGIHEALVIATGNQYSYIKSLLSNNVEYVPDLTLKGLAALFDRNSKK